MEELRDVEPWPINCAVGTRVSAEGAVGVIGLGPIGHRVLAGLHANTVPAVAFDLAPAALDAWRVTSGIRLVSSPAEVAASAHVVAIAVRDAEQVLDLLDGPTGLLASARRGSVIAVLSTISIADLAHITERCSAHGVEVIDCGVTVMLARPEDETSLVAMYGGSAEAKAVACGAIRAFAFEAIDCGGPSSGMIAKISRNVWHYASWFATRSAVSVLEANGTDPRLLKRIIETADPELRMPFVLEGILEEDLTGERRQRVKGFLAKDLCAAEEELQQGSIGADLVALMIAGADRLLGLGQPSKVAHDSDAR